jgi:hypothetical protein
MPTVPTTLSELEELTTVEYIAPPDDDKIYMVGEQHEDPGASICAEVAENLIDKIEPSAVAIEMPPGTRARDRAAMGVARQYVEGNPDVDGYYVDEPRDELRACVDNYIELSRCANKFSEPIEDDGDLDQMAIYDARSRVKNEFGGEAYRKMYEEREKAMAARVRWLHEQQPGVTLWVGGVFHIKEMWDKLYLSTSHIPPNLQRDPQPISASDGSRVV